MQRTKQYKSFRHLAPKEEKSPNNSQCVEIQDENHRQGIIANNKIVCIDLFADWCQPCKVVSPQFAKLAEKYNNNGLCALVKENVDKKLTKDYRITGIPAFIFYRHGQLLMKDSETPVAVIGGELDNIESILNQLLREEGEGSRIPKNEAGQAERYSNGPSYGQGGSNIRR